MAHAAHARLARVRVTDHLARTIDTELARSVVNAKVHARAVRALLAGTYRTRVRALPTAAHLTCSEITSRRAGTVNAGLAQVRVASIFAHAADAGHASVGVTA